MLLTLKLDWPKSGGQLRASVLEFLQNSPIALSADWITVVIDDRASDHESGVGHRLIELLGVVEGAAFIEGLIQDEVAFHWGVVAPDACEIERVTVTFDRSED